jgi:heme/copper-type cytochrome/quinol oxidase subunit 2
MIVFILCVVGWFVGSFATKLFVRFTTDNVAHMGDPDEAAMYCSPFLPFWPIMLLACIAIWPVVVWHALTDRF